MTCRAEEISFILQTAGHNETIADAKCQKDAPGICRANRLWSLFYENSTQYAPHSFELAGKYLGATVSNLGVSTSSVNKGETLLDTGKTIESYGHRYHRHTASAGPVRPSFFVTISQAVSINAGDGMARAHRHRQLLDMLTMQEHFGGIRRPECGDHRRHITQPCGTAATSGGLTKLGAKVNAVRHEVR